MYSLLLAIIYLAFISLGLPDSLLGSGWPVMHVELGVALSYQGAISMTIAAGTIISSLLSDKLTKKLGTGKVTAISVTLTAVAILGFSFSKEFWQLCLLAVPYGLGAGAIDAALNNYVALHYKAKHMSWLHAFWGVGTIISPYIMGACLGDTLGWTGGYRIVSYIQIGLAVVLFVSLPLWKRTNRAAPLSELPETPADEATDPAAKTKGNSILQTLKTRGVVFLMIAFCCYCAVEQTAMLWASSYLVQYRGISAERAAMFASLFFIGITAGRMICGFITEKLGDKLLIRIGTGTILLGVLFIAIPTEANGLCLAGLIVAGIGCAPIYPSVIHETPTVFGAEKSQAIIGAEMASAYVGTTFMPPLFGVIAQYVNIAFLPLYLFVFTVVMLLSVEIFNRKAKRPNATDTPAPVD